MDHLSSFFPERVGTFVCVLSICVTAACNKSHVYSNIKKVYNFVWL